MAERRLVRSSTNRMVGGVCAGLGAYLRIDPTLVRLFFVLLALAEGIGFALYLILWVLTPREDLSQEPSFEGNARIGAGEIAERAREMSEEAREGLMASGHQTGFFIGVALILVGVFNLLKNLNIYWLAWLRWDAIWPALLILAGGLLLLRQIRGA